MQVVVKVLRRHGVALPFARVQAAKWILGRLHRSTGGRLTLELLGATPGMGVLLELYHPALVRVVESSIVLRGIERIETNGQPAAVIQEWRVSARPGAGSVDDPSPEQIVDFVEVG